MKKSVRVLNKLKRWAFENRESTTFYDTDGSIVDGVTYTNTISLIKKIDELIIEENNLSNKSEPETNN
jgi:hypothetical protein